MNPKTHQKPVVKLDEPPKAQPEGTGPTSRARRPTLVRGRTPPRQRLPTKAQQPTTTQDELAPPPLAAQIDLAEWVRALELLVEPELPVLSAPVDPVASLASTIDALLRTPEAPLQDVIVRPETFSRVLEMIGSQTSTFSAAELALEVGKTVEEIEQLVKRREQAARLVVRMTESRLAQLSELDEYWVQRAWLQLSMPGQSRLARTTNSERVRGLTFCLFPGHATPDLALPASSYYFDENRKLTLQVPFFRGLLYEASPTKDAARAVQHFITLLPRLTLTTADGFSHPQRDVIEVLDLILERCRIKTTVTFAHQVIAALVDLRRPQTSDQAHRGDVSFLLRRTLQGFDGSWSDVTPSQSITMYEHLRDLGLSSDLGSAALVQFGLSMTQLWASAKVLDNPTLSSRHFHLLAYRMLQMSEAVIENKTLSGGQKFFETSRLARVFRRMGSDVEREKVRLSTDLRDKIVEMLSRNGSQSIAAWIYLNHPTYPAPPSDEAQRRPVTITLDSTGCGGTPTPSPPVKAGLLPLPLSLARQLFLILLHGRPPHANLVLALSILETIPPQNQHIRFYNLLLRQAYSNIPRRDEADAFASLVHNLLATHSHLKPNLQTLEAHLHAWPKTSRHLSQDAVERDHVEGYRAAAMDAYFALVEQRGDEFRKRTWDLLVGSVSRECGGEAGREAIEWMRIKGRMEPDQETWGIWLDGAERVWDGRETDKAALTTKRVERLIVEEGVRHDKSVKSQS